MENQSVGKPTDYLSFGAIVSQYPGTAKEQTLRCWKFSNRYGFGDICTKVGGRVVVRRDRWESFLDSRTGLGGE